MGTNRSRRMVHVFSAILAIDPIYERQRGICLNASTRIHAATPTGTGVSPASTDHIDVLSVKCGSVQLHQSPTSRSVNGTARSSSRRALHAHADPAPTARSVTGAPYGQRGSVLFFACIVILGRICTDRPDALDTVSIHCMCMH